jgi:IS1 family transposase
LSAQIFCETYGDAWVWLAFAPVWRVVLAFVVGKRTQKSANQLLDRMNFVTDNYLPLLTSDQLPEYAEALLHPFGRWFQPERQGTRGRYPNLRRLPVADLLYAQVVKVRDGSRLVELKTRVVYGSADAVAARLADTPVSITINTSFVERDNLTQRQSNRRLTRRTNGSSKDIAWFEKQLWLSMAYYHLVLPHHSLRRPLTTPVRRRRARN